MKSLVIAEKPSVARDIARVLGANQKNGGILEGKNYVVTWALGHLVTLADPEEYDRKYEKWKWRPCHAPQGDEAGQSIRRQAGNFP